MKFTHQIMRDNSYDMVGFQEQLEYGRRTGVDLSNYDIVHYAEAFGARGYRVTTEPELRATLAQALQKDDPSIIRGARHEEGRCKL